jgi:formate dehydrogenase iron-sulfur subunit
MLRPAAPALAGKSRSENEVALLVDVTKCVSCWWCYAACKNFNMLPETILPDPARPPRLSPDVWTTLNPVMTDDGWQSRKHACNHCTDAACVGVCPTGALSYNSLGFVQYDKDKCSGCGYCAEFCPFGIPQLESNRVTGLAVMSKCTFCYDRVTGGEQTACAAACTTGAIKFGRRDELLQEGKERVASLKKANLKASLYGENEAGGLHVLYVLDDSPDVYGLPDAPKVPISAKLRDIFSWLGIGFTALVLAGFGLNYLVAKARMAKGEKE